MRQIIKKLLIIYGIFAGCLLIGCSIIGYATKPELVVSHIPITIPTSFYVIIVIVWITSLIGVIATLVRNGRQYMLQSAVAFTVYFSLLFFVSLVSLLLWSSIYYDRSFLGDFIEFFGTGALWGRNLIGLLAVVFSLASVLGVFAIVLQLILNQSRIRYKKSIGTLLGIMSVAAVMVLEDTLYPPLKNLAIFHIRKNYDLATALIVLSVCVVVQYAHVKKHKQTA